MKIQFSLPFKEAKKLPADQMLKILKVQGKKLRLEEFELQKLTQMCLEKNCIDKGLGVIYEFSGYIDRIAMLMQKRKKYSMEVMGYWNSSADCSSDSGFMKSISKLAEVTAKLLHSICVWRKLNWNPRPLYNVSNNNEILDNLLPVAMHDSGRSTVQSILLEEAYRIMSSAQDNEIDLFSFVPLSVLVVLLSPAIDATEFRSIMQSRSQENGDSMGNSIDLVRSFDEVATPSLSTNLIDTCSAIRNIINIENRIEKIWTEISLGRRGTYSVKNIIESFPVLRIPYFDTLCDHEDFRWYGEVLKDYSKAILLIATEIQNGSFAPIGMDTFPFDASLASSLNGIGLNASLMEGSLELKQSSVMDSEHMLEEYSDTEVSDGMRSPTTLHDPIVAVSKAASPPKDSSSISKKGNGEITPSKGTGKGAASKQESPSFEEKVTVVTKSPNNIPIVRRVRQTMVVSGKSSENLTNVVPTTSNNDVINETTDDDNEAKTNVEKGVEAVNVVMAAAKISRKLAASAKKLSGKDNSQNNTSTKQGTNAIAANTSQKMPAANNDSSNRPRSQSSNPNPTGKLSSTDNNQQNDEVYEYRNDRSKSAPVDRVERVEHSLIDPKTIAYSSSKSKSSSSSTIPTVPSTPVSLVTSSSTSALQTAPNGALGLSPTNLYQFQNGAFIPVILQPTIPVESLQQDHNGVVRFPPMHTMHSNPTMFHSHSNSSNSIGSIGMRPPSQTFDFSTTLPLQTLADVDEEEGIIQRSPALHATPGTSDASLSVNGRPRHNGRPDSSNSFQAQRIPSNNSTMGNSRQSSYNNSTFLGVKQISNSLITPIRPGTGNGNSRSVLSPSPPPTSDAFSQSHSHSHGSSSNSIHSGSTTPKTGRGNKLAHPNSGNFNSKSLASLGILQSLVNLDLVTRGEMLADSQVVNVAFKYIDMGGGTIVHLAARKIGIWWKFIYPRRRLMRRLNVRNFILGIVHDMANAAVAHSIVVQRRRNKFLREGSATKIQRCFRLYRDTVLAEEKAQELADRRQQAQEMIGKLCKILRICIWVHKFVKRVHLKFKKKKRSKIPPHFKLTSEIVFLRIKDVKLREALEHIQSNSKKVVRDVGRIKAYQEREQAAVRLQNIGRILNSRKIFTQKKFERKMKRRILSFFILCHYKFKKEKVRQRHKCATNIQRIVRGLLVRNELTKVVKAGMMLNALWRKHRAFRTLKQNLRRVEKPVNIVLEKLRNIPAQLIHTDQLKIKVSVWWHPLLHIVSETDFATIIQNKQPQLVYTTKAFVLMRTEAPTPKESKKKSQGGSKSGSFMISPSSVGSRLSTLFRGRKNTISTDSPPTTVPLVAAMSDISELSTSGHMNPPNGISLAAISENGYQNNNSSGSGNNSVGNNEEGPDLLSASPNNSITRRLTSHQPATSKLPPIPNRKANSTPNMGDGSGGSYRKSVISPIKSGVPSPMMTTSNARSTSNNNNSNSNSNNNSNNNSLVEEGSFPLEAIDSCVSGISESSLNQNDETDKPAISNSRTGKKKNSEESGNSAGDMIPIEGMESSISALSDDVGNTDADHSERRKIAARQSIHRSRSSRKSIRKENSSKDMSSESDSQRSSGRSLRRQRSKRVVLEDSNEASDLTDNSNKSTKTKKSLKAIALAAKALKKSGKNASSKSSSKESSVKDSLKDSSDVNTADSAVGESSNPAAAVGTDATAAAVTAAIDAANVIATASSAPTALVPTMPTRTIITSRPSNSRTSFVSMIRQPFPIRSRAPPNGQSSSSSSAGRASILSLGGNGGFAPTSAAGENEGTARSNEGNALVPANEGAGSSSGAPDASGDMNRTSSFARVNRGTTFFSGRIGLGTIISPQLLQLSSRISMHGKNAARIKESSGEGEDDSDEDDSDENSDDEDDEDEDDDEDPSDPQEANYLDSDSDEDDDEENIPAGNALPIVTKRPIRNTLLRKTFLSGGSMLLKSFTASATLLNSSSNNINSGTKGRAPSFISGLTSQFRKTMARVTRVTRIGGRRRHKKNDDNLIQPKFYCDFENETIRIPGCHGNSVIRFEFLDGERKVATHNFFMCKEGSVMFWGGAFTRQLYISQARRVGMNSRMLEKKSHQFADNPNLPYFDFKIAAGSALKSRAQWAKIAVKGNGPAKRAAHKNIISAFFFTSWRRLFLSMNEDGLSMYERRSNNIPLVYVSVADMESVRIEQVANTNVGKQAAKSEDVCVVIITTKLNDKIYIRSPDIASRFAWNDILNKAIDDYKRATAVVGDGHMDLLSSMASTTRMFTNLVTGASNIRMKRNSSADASNIPLTHNDGSSENVEYTNDSRHNSIDSLSPMRSAYSNSSLSPSNSNSSIPIMKMDSQVSRASGRKLATVVENPSDFSGHSRNSRSKGSKGSKDADDDDEVDNW